MVPELQFTEIGVVGLAIYGIVMISGKVIDLLKVKTEKPEEKTSKAHPDKLSVLLENNNKAITELTHFLRTQSEVNTERDRQVEKHMDSIEQKVDKIRDILTQHCLDSNH